MSFFFSKEILDEGNQRLPISINSVEWSQDTFKDQDRTLLNTYTQGNTVNRELGKHDRGMGRQAHTMDL